MSDWPIPGSYESYKKAILDRQVTAQERAAKYAREGLQAERATREVMVATIEAQTADLRATLSQSAEQIVSELGVQGDRICGSLEEIRWEVAQVGRTMDQLLEVALNSRTNEANQLVKQGVRHFANEEYLEAEGRFLRALEYDSTDYQVLMNLGFIAVHKGQPDAALTYFKKALTLPDSLNNPAKARALWALARVHYSQKRFPDAFTTAKQAKSLSTPELAADVLTMGVYATPLGKTDLAIKHCRQALTLDPSVFSTIAAYAELDLQPIRDKVMAMLAESASATLNTVMEVRQQVEALLTKIKAGKPKDDLVLSWIGKMEQQLEILDEGLKSPTYVFLVEWQRNLSRLGDLLQTLVETAALCKKKKSAQKDVNDAKAWVEDMGEVETSVSNELPDWLWPSVYYAIPMICVIFPPDPLPASRLSPGSPGVGSEASALQIISGILWPLFGPLWLLAALVGVGGAGAIVGRVFLGLLIDGGIVVVRRALTKSEEASLDARKREKSNRSGKLSKESSALSDIDRSIRDKDKQMKAAYESLCDKG